MKTELNIDEIALADFFGVLPEEQDPEEKEFFGSACFKVPKGDLTLSVSFSSHHSDMILSLTSAKSGQEILTAKIDQIVELRVREKFLLVMTRNEKGSALDPKEAASITLEPLNVSFKASEQSNDE